MNDGLALRVEGVHVRFAARPVLRGASFTASRGEVVALFGPSGGGKTTLLRTINYLTPFDAGRIEVLGHALLPGMSERRHARELVAVRRKVGMVFQHFHLFPHRTVFENLTEAPLYALGWPAKRAEKRACAWLERLHLEHLRDALPRTLSGGEQQRVSLARALMLEPDILLLDEPTSALDASRQELIAQVVTEFAGRGGSVVLATHQPEFARQVASRALLLHEGRIVAEGSSDDVLREARALHLTAVTS